MAHRGKRAGKRGSDFRPSRQSSDNLQKERERLRDIHSTTDRNRFSALPSRHSFTAVAGEIVGAFNAHAEGENYHDHGIPGIYKTVRRSLTDKLGLGMFPTKVETEPTPTRQLDKKTGKMVETTDNRITWRSDRSLLNTRKPYERIGGFWRITSQTKRKKWIDEDERIEYRPYGPDVDDHDLTNFGD